MSVIVFTLILLVTMISLKKRKKEEESFEPQQFFEFEENNIEEFKEKTPIVEEKKVKFVYDKDYADMVWDDRPLMPSTPIWCVPENLCGENVSEKLKRVRESMAEEKSENLLISKLFPWLRRRDLNPRPFGP